jgi:hypothetical protein
MGTGSGSVDLTHNVPGTPVLEENAAHVRRHHVPTVVAAEAEPERVMQDFKAYASRRLNGMNLDKPNRKRWARHGSTRWLWKSQHVSAAIEYVIAEQGDAMSAFESQEH